MPSAWWQAGELRRAVSYLTGREVVINTDPGRFLLLEERCSRAAFQRTLEAWTARWKSLSRSLWASSHLETLVSDALTRADDLHGLGALFDSLFAAADRWNNCSRSVGLAPWKRTDGTRIRELVLAFYNEGVIAFPAERFELFPKIMFQASDLSEAGLAGEQWIGATKGKAAHILPAVTRTLLSRVGVRSVGDLTPDVVGSALSRYRTAPALARGLWKVQRAEHEGQLKHSVDNFGPFGRPAERGRDGLDFEWASRRDPGLQAWCGLASEFLATRDSAKRQSMAGLIAFLEHLVAHPGVPREPAAYLTRGAELPVRFRHSHQHTQNYVAAFLDWVLDTHFSEEADDGAPVRLRGYANPVERTTGRPKESETRREAMPTRLLRLALEILTENDWAWARKQDTDVFHARNPETGQWEQRWSPARAVALFVLMRMPFRSFQVRMEDSGEADTMVYDVRVHAMVPNTGPLRSGSPASPVQKGALQALPGTKGGPVLPVIRLSTNKTADIGKEGWQRGYDCPYAPDDVVAALAWLRVWQAEHNPIAAPTDWSDVRELTDKKTMPELVGMRSCFLFRDPCAERPAEPVTHSRLWQLWLRLLVELEARLAEQGITGANDEKIILINSWSKGHPTGAVYDLHTLRVTLITAFYEDGKVPAEILMKIVGHATVVMTLYYAKLGAAYIADEMSLGATRVQEAEKANWLRFHRSRSMNSLRQAVAWNDEAGLAAFTAGPNAGLQMMNVGLCPVGCGMCQRGGKEIEGTGGRTLYGPVPAGRSNCAECRFLISGPPFRLGIQAEFNARSLALAKLTRERDDLETAFDVLDAERRASAAEGEPFLRHREWTRAGNDLDDLTARVDQVGRQMQNLAALDAQIERLPALGKEAGDRTLSLVVGDPASVMSAFEESTEFDLADRVCRSAIVFPSVSATDANRLRMRKYDQMLRRNGLAPVFLDMDEATALRAGNQLTEFLAKCAGSRPAVLKLVEGEETMVRLGILPKELLDSLEGMAGQCFAPLPARGALLEAPSLVGGE